MPPNIEGLVWWLFNGAIVALLAICAWLLKRICANVDAIDARAHERDSAIVELQTICSMNHNSPIRNKLTQGAIQ
jgi:hypothetical protein